MGQIDYNKIKQKNIEFSERPKMFSELKVGDVMFALDLDTLNEIYVEVNSVKVEEKVEVEYSLFEGEEKKFPYSKVTMTVQREDNKEEVELYPCYGTQTFTLQGNLIYFTTEREREAIDGIISEKCECQVSHLRAMFNGALATKQYIDPNTIVLG